MIGVQLGRWLALTFLLATPASSAGIENCPVRFGNLPASGTVDEIGAGSLVTGGLKSIQTLTPLSEGLLAIRSGETGTGEVYGEYWARQPKTRTREYRLSMGAN